LIHQYGKTIIDEAYLLEEKLFKGSNHVSRELANTNALNVPGYLKNPGMLRYFVSGIAKSLLYRSKVNANLFWK